MSNGILNENGRHCVFRSGENWFGIPAEAIRGRLPYPKRIHARC